MSVCQFVWLDEVFGERYGAGLITRMHHGELNVGSILFVKDHPSSPVTGENALSRSWCKWYHEPFGDVLLSWDGTVPGFIIGGTSSAKERKILAQEALGNIKETKEDDAHGTGKRCRIMSGKTPHFHDQKSLFRPLYVVPGRKRWSIYIARTVRMWRWAP